MLCVAPIWLPAEGESEGFAQVNIQRSIDTAFLFKLDVYTGKTRTVATAPLRFGDFVLECFERTGTPPSSVCFEITETAAISNLARAARFIGRFRDLGCRFALDDFGAGLSSFAYLKSLPVDYLKIDGGFVRGSSTDAVDLAAVDAVRRLAHAVGAKTIAECVETPQILERMRDLGIDFAQGHLIHEPEPYSALAARLDYPTLGNCVVAAA